MPVDFHGEFAILVAQAVDNNGLHAEPRVARGPESMLFAAAR